MTLPISRAVEFRVLSQGCRGVNRFTCARFPALHDSKESGRQQQHWGVNYCRQGFFALFWLVAICALTRHPKESKPAHSFEHTNWRYIFVPVEHFNGTRSLKMWWIHCWNWHWFQQLQCQKCLRRLSARLTAQFAGDFLNYMFVFFNECLCTAVENESVLMSVFVNWTNKYTNQCTVQNNDVPIASYQQRPTTMLASRLCYGSWRFIPSVRTSFFMNTSIAVLP